MQFFGPFHMLTVHKCSATGFFGIKVTWIFQFITLEINNFAVSSFFSKYSKFYVDSGYPEKIVALNTRFYWEGILVIGCQYVNK